jgi:hypothetical protein
MEFESFRVFHPIPANDEYKSHEKPRRAIGVDITGIHGIHDTYNQQRSGEHRNREVRRPPVF